MKRYHYYNLHRHCWSAMERGRVVAHPRAVAIHGAEFRVRPGGREKVLREGRKNVHAFVVANHAIDLHDVPGTPDPAEGWVEVTYNPYKAATFTRRDTGLPVRRARFVLMTPDRKVWAQGVTA